MIPAMEERILDSLRGDADFMAQVVHWEVIPEREGLYAEFPVDLNPDLLRVLKRGGIERLYTHQARTYAEALQGT